MPRCTPEPFVCSQPEAHTAISQQHAKHALHPQQVWLTNAAGPQPAVVTKADFKELQLRYTTSVQLDKQGTARQVSMHRPQLALLTRLLLVFVMLRCVSSIPSAQHNLCMAV